MKKIFTAAQIHELDQYTIDHEPIKSIDLMERAARAITDAILAQWDSSVPVVVFAGPGNNGGDALAVARMLNERHYQVQAFLFNISGKLSDDCAENKERLSQLSSHHSPLLTEVTQRFDPPQLEEGMLVIDGLFGSGLNKPLTGGFASLVKYINASHAEVVSIDVPSGLMTEDNSCNVRTNIVRADVTFSLQHTKLCYLFAEYQQFIGHLQLLPIGLSQEGINSTDAQFTMVERDDVSRLLMPRDPFAHKGSMGHALLVAGSYGMAGAAILAARACMRSGAGKLTLHTPRRNVAVLQTAVPEAVLHVDHEETAVSEAIPADNFQAVAVGPGIGTGEQTGVAILSQLRRARCPAIADADALNIFAAKHALMEQLPKGIILTPHPGELERLEGECTDSYERLMKARMLAEHLQGYVILKGHHTAVCMPDGHVAFNTTGNAGMATAGSGDVLTGILLGLLARGYAKREACIIGVYLHGLAGDLAARELGEESLMAGDIISFLPKAFAVLRDKN